MHKTIASVFDFDQNYWLIIYYEIAILCDRNLDVSLFPIFRLSFNTQIWQRSDNIESNDGERERDEETLWEKLVAKNGNNWIWNSYCISRNGSVLQLSYARGRTTTEIFSDHIR